MAGGPRRGHMVAVGGEHTGGAEGKNTRSGNEVIRDDHWEHRAMEKKRMVGKLVFKKEEGGGDLFTIVGVGDLRARMFLPVFSVDEKWTLGIEGNSDFPAASTR